MGWRFPAPRGGMRERPAPRDRPAGHYRVPTKIVFQLRPVGCVRALTTSTTKPASSMRAANR